MYIAKATVRELCIGTGRLFRTEARVHMPLYCTMLHEKASVVTNSVTVIL
jgi:hypothetical protein